MRTSVFRANHAALFYVIFINLKKKKKNRFSFFIVLFPIFDYFYHTHKLHEYVFGEFNLFFFVNLKNTRKPNRRNVFLWTMIVLLLCQVAFHLYPDRWCLLWFIVMHFHAGGSWGWIQHRASVSTLGSCTALTYTGLQVLFRSQTLFFFELFLCPLKAACNPFQTWITGAWAG